MAAAMAIEVFTKRATPRNAFSRCSFGCQDTLRICKSSNTACTVACLCEPSTVLVTIILLFLQLIWCDAVCSHLLLVHTPYCLQAGAVVLAVLQLQRLPRGCTTGSHHRTQHTLDVLQDKQVAQTYR
jgi:hypothetical protein